MSEDRPQEGADRSGRVTRKERRRGKYEARHSTPLERGVGRKVLIGVNVLVAVALVIGASGFAYAEWRLHEIHHVRIRSLTAVGHDLQSKKPATQAASSAGPPETILLVGSDSRAALQGTASANQYGAASLVGGARSDTIMLIRLVPATKQVEILSIPRDTYVHIAGLGNQKINAALGVSPDLLISTIQQQFGVDINHYVDIDFQSFKDIADAIGGVSIYFPTPARDMEETEFQIPQAGCVNLTGNMALDFVRSRMYEYKLDGYWHQEAESDLARIERQQMFMRKLVAKAERTGLGNPIALNGIIGGVTKNLTVDSSFSVDDMISLAGTFASISPTDIPGYTMPTYAVTLPGPDDVLMPEQAADRAMVAQFLAFGETPASPTSTTTTTAVPALGGSTTSTTSAVALGSFSVRVENGSGVSGQAGEAASSLRSAGFDVASVGSASSYGYSASVIEYGSGEEQAAATLQSSIGGGATLEEASGLGSELVLITGRSYSGVTAPSGAGAAVTTTTISPSTATTVPATTTTTYALPGTPAGGTPACN